MTDLDVIVIGGGLPGEHTAGALAEGGLKVAVDRARAGRRECSYYACMPSKTLLRPGEAVQAARDALATASVDAVAVFAWHDFMVIPRSCQHRRRGRRRNAVSPGNPGADGGSGGTE